MFPLSNILLSVCLLQKYATIFFKNSTNNLNKSWFNFIILYIFDGKEIIFKILFDERV